jgi:RNA polymerase sigma-70 factor (ECF subfamily)
VTTLWSLVRQAHAGSSDGVTEAQQRLLERYCGAAYRYLLGALRDEAAAAELFQEFAMRFLRGDFRRADPGRGRFRDYVRTALIHLVSDYRTAERRRPVSLPGDVPAADPAACEPDADAQFLASWREELLSRTWAALETSNPSLHGVLLLRVQEPQSTAAELAKTITAQLARPFSASHVRVALHRARARFAELLVAQVASSMESPSPQDLQAELRTLGLLPYCLPAGPR